MNTIKPGVCGICGCAVVQPEEPGPGWTNGHLFKGHTKPTHTNYGQETKGLVLTRVRCMTHKEPGDPRRYDKDGNVVEYRDIEDGCVI